MLEKTELKRLIDQEYIQPWIQVLEKNLSVQDKVLFLQEAIYEFQCRIFYPLPTIRLFLDNFAYRFAHKKYTFYMVSNDDLLVKSMRVAEIYLTNIVNNTEYKPGLIASIIRDKLFDYLNPLPFFNIPLINSNTICNVIQEGDISPNIPWDLVPSVYGYLDYTSRSSFARTSKNAYFFHKSEIAKPDNVFYILGNEVQITETEGIWGLNDHKCLVNAIPQYAILNSIRTVDKPSKQPKSFKAFTSLLHAIEYAHHQKHDDGGEDRDKDGFMPTVWMVLYVGNRNHLVFTEECLHINEGIVAKQYEDNFRIICSEKGEMPHNSVYSA